MQLPQFHLLISVGISFRPLSLSFATCSLIKILQRFYKFYMAVAGWTDTYVIHY